MQAAQASALWRAVGKALKRVMTQQVHEDGSITGGHIVFGWCHAGQYGAPVSTQNNAHPGAIVASSAGIPVYAPSGYLAYPKQGPVSGRHHEKDEDHPDGYGEPFGQPYPEDGVEPPGENPEEKPGKSGWVKFPPTIPPRAGEDAPTSVTPADACGENGVGILLPKELGDPEADDEGDPDAGDTLEDSHDPEGDGNPVTEDDVPAASAPTETHAAVPEEEDPCDDVDCTDFTFGQDLGGEGIRCAPARR